MSAAPSGAGRGSMSGDDWKLHIHAWPVPRRTAESCRSSLCPGAASALKVRGSHLFCLEPVVEVFGSGPAGAAAWLCGPALGRNVNVPSARGRCDWAACTKFEGGHEAGRGEGACGRHAGPGQCAGPDGGRAEPDGGRTGADIVPLCGLPADLHHYVLTKWQKPHMLAVGRGRIPARGGR